MWFNVSSIFFECECFSSWDTSILRGLTGLPPSSGGARLPSSVPLGPSFGNSLFVFWEQWHSCLSHFHSCKEGTASLVLPRVPEDSFNFWLPSRSSKDLPDEAKKGSILSPARLLPSPSRGRSDQKQHFLQERAGPRVFSKRHQDQNPLLQPSVASTRSRLAWATRKFQASQGCSVSLSLTNPPQFPAKLTQSCSTNKTRQFCLGNH